MVSKDYLAKIKKDKMPEHIAIIMDGNGRWAKQHNRQRIVGHKKGVDALRKVVELSGNINLPYLTVYAFSTENWRRENFEVNYLLKLIMNSLLKEIDNLNENNVKIKFIGSKKKLSESYYKRVVETCKKSWNNTGLQLNIAMNYGGRREIIEALNKIIGDVQNNKLKLPIREKDFNKYLYTKDMPDPDLIIRTSGEQRLSNFLVWQSAYAELWFTEKYWPDFSKNDLLEAIIDFQKRKRRYGGRK